MVTKDETRRPTLISSTDCRSFTKLNMLRFCLKYVGMKRFLWREILAFEHSKNTWYSSPITFMAHLPQYRRSLSKPAYRPVSISSLWLQHLNFTIFLQMFRGSVSRYASSSNLILRFLYSTHLVLASIVLDHSCLNWSYQHLWYAPVNCTCEDINVWISWKKLWLIMLHSSSTLIWLLASHTNIKQSWFSSFMHPVQILKL